MAFDPVSALFGIGKSVIERIWPDPVKQAEEIRKLQALQQAGDLAELEAAVNLLTGQMEINKVEAAHKSVFVAGWRPAIGWTGALALAYQFIVHPALLWLWTITDALFEIPSAVKAPALGDTEALYTIILGMLGIGAMRSVDKYNGVDTRQIGK